jgi:N-methylhydantoinase A
LAELGTEAVAVCFLHAYANPAHEERAAELLAEHLEVPISCSSQVLAEHREYERFATTALNAYVAPRMSRYLARLARALAEGGLRAEPEIMSSSGGSWPFERMARLPVNSMLSGPAGGVIGAVAFAGDLGVSDLITYDMGGTSTDVSLVREGRYALAMEGSVGELPNRAPQIEINTVGAGGGSIAYLDQGGFLCVGPRSAGAEPGPACYGRGGTAPTVTDANVALGRLRPADRLGGAVTVDVEAAGRAVDALAVSLGLDRAATADGIVRIAVARMTGAIKEISVMRGIDPRDLSLLAYGGAGPLHAALVARELGMPRVVVPPIPGAFSAYGLLVAEPRIDLSMTRLTPLAGTSMAELHATFEPLRERARDALSAQGFADAQMRFEAAVDMRYVGQAFELTTPLHPDVQSVEALVDVFHAVYEERYTHAGEGPVEAVSFRLSAYGASARPALPRARQGGGVARAVGARAVHFAGEAIETPLFERDALAVGIVIPGPAIVEEPGSATLVPPGMSLECHPSGALILT